MQQNPTLALDQLVEQLGEFTSAADDFDKITQLEQLQRLVNATHSAIARVSIDFDESQRAEHRRLKVRSPHRGRGVADQIALARRLSPSRASRELGFARALRDDLPTTAALLRAGRISDDVAHAVHRETNHLEPAFRRSVDAELADVLPDATVLGAAGATRQAAYEADPESTVKRAAKAAKDRRVWARPAPDAMCQVSALLPAAIGVSAFATLRRDALGLIATGDAGDRTLNQVMSDLFAQRLTGQSVAGATPVEVQLVMTPGMLFGDDAEPGSQGDTAVTDDDDSGTDDPPASARASQPHSVDNNPDGAAWLVGYGPIPAALGRAILAGVPDLFGATPSEIDRGQAWIRRLFTDPVTGQLTAVDARRRRFDGTVRRFIQIRDRVCRTPFCDAPIRDHDHLQPHAEGGPTDVANGAGVCQRFNHVKQMPGWSTTVIHGSDRPNAPPGKHRHTVRITTPTGKTYTSIPPPVHGTRPNMLPRPRTGRLNVEVYYLHPPQIRLAS